MKDKTLLIGRAVAALLALAMSTYFATDNFGGEPARRWDNPFLVPDLLIIAFLGVAALLP